MSKNNLPIDHFGLNQALFLVEAQGIDRQPRFLGEFTN